jgi:outer membrane protein OmpA-like peptidoglycan-associated protein
VHVRRARERALPRATWTWTIRSRQPRISLSTLAALRAALSIALFLVATSRLAFAGDVIKVELVPKAQQGQGTPELVVRAEASIASLDLSITRSSDGKKIKQSSGAVSAGKLHRFPLEIAKPGKARFSGTLAVRLEDGQGGEMPIDVEAELLPQLEVKVAPEDVDLEKRKLRLSANRPLKKVQISVMSDVGTPLGTTEVPVDGSAAEVSWDQSKGTPMRITLQAWDEDEFFGAVELFPWRVDIPHEEVNFATGSHEVAGAEAPKLDKSLALIKDAIAKYGKLATIRLFIAGHTDTVGDAASNRALSDRRAQSIGRWFAQHGVKIPILYAGFGEDLLLVKTPDQTDEAKNRRAEYIVAVDAPAMKGATFRPL